MQDLHRGTITRAYCRAIYEESVSRCFILPPLAGEVRCSRIGGGERSEPIRRMLILPYDTENQSRNADFMIIALRAIHNPRPEGPSNLRTLRPSGRSILRTFFFTTLLHNPRRSRAPFLLRRSRHHNPRPERPSNLRTLRTLGAQPRQPSRRRCVQRRQPPPFHLHFQVLCYT